MKQRHEYLSGAKIKLRDQALDRVGAQLFGPYWFNGADVDEAGRAQLPKDPKRAAEIAKLQHPFMTYNWQVDAVIHWLQHEHGVDVEAETFDSAKFEEFFLANFGPTAVELSPLDNALLERWEAGERPGRDGTTTWPKFSKAIRKQLGGKWSVQTIKRHLAKLNKSS